MRGSTALLAVLEKPTTMRPWSPLTYSRAQRCSSSTLLKVRRACLSMAAPATVRDRLRGLRSNSTMPSSSSSLRMAVDKGGWAMCRRSAARWKFRVSESTTNCCN
ncbi:Uncharacterised protein [Bordetella pertussis]|nr:Uncharacterised protein [Bordetella pertussis]CFP68957.1 Uncharacterised protein [Bordetella pertussis]CFU09631.1 Uncharacterised protein [Bordetella pertussis]CFW14350.1 Uncharacterised protein [Bordetella pertussis]